MVSEEIAPEGIEPAEDMGPDGAHEVEEHGRLEAPRQRPETGDGTAVRDKRDKGQI